MKGKRTPFERICFSSKKDRIIISFCTFVGRKLMSQTMDTEQISVMGLYSQNENKVPATLLQIINRGG